MKKILLVVFSGTGNTLTVAQLLKKYFQEQDCHVHIFEIKKPFITIENINNYDIVGFGYPVHAFNIPKIYRKYLKYIPKAKNISAFVFKTSGEPFRLNNASSYILTKRLKRKGYIVHSDTHFLMPYNIIFRYPDQAVHDMLYYADGLSQILSYDILSETKEKLTYRIRYRIISFILRIQYLGATLNGLLSKVNRELCTQCLLCVKNCPTNNIRLKKNKIKFSGKCTMCMRCAMMCPKNAIKIGFWNKWKVNGKYDFNNILKSECISNGFFLEERKDFFRYFKDYYANLDNKINEFKLRF